MFANGQLQKLEMCFNVACLNDFSARLGREEDLQDMEMEEMEKKRKMMRKKGKKQHNKVSGKMSK